jgi:hypothetical protein
MVFKSMAAPMPAPSELCRGKVLQDQRQVATTSRSNDVLGLASTLQASG